MNENRVLQILKSPHVSEKAAMAAEIANQYVFKVATDATKREVKKAVEVLFEVEVDSVRVLNVKGKEKRFGSRLGKRSDWRKAYVRLKEGQDIELVGAE
ncbi:MAG TPA: 50S ribosomal protein L23 [Gammaproteobacteria bacterium]|nr:50S ribosomal protein L23 [Gammaproteobacteria bacterium]